MEKKINEIRERLDRVNDGEHEIGNLCISLSLAIDVIEELKSELEHFQNAYANRFESYG